MHALTGGVRNILLAFITKLWVFIGCWGARWLSGRASDSGERGRGFETYLRRVVSLTKTLLPESTGNTEEAVAPSQHVC